MTVFKANAQKALADWGAASNLFEPWETLVCSRLFHGARLLAITSLIGIIMKGKKETNNNSPEYLWLFCASLGTWELPALSRIVGGIEPTIPELNFSRR